ncbi:MAG: TetR/AcrR family transcriptional regulator [Methylovulum sp.]|nr:TetR/AcrR family transcriptional regulator [Methylovulum sp.]
MARRSEHSQEEIKAMVLAAAEMIVAEQGFPALTMRKIAGRIGYTVGSIYMVFDNMADLVLHINAETLGHIAVQLGQAQQGAGAAGIEAFAKAYLRYAQQNLNRWRLIFDYHLPEDTPIPAWYQAKIDRVFGLVETQFAQLVEDGSETAQKHAARTLWAGVHGVCVLSLNGALGAAGVSDVENSVVLLTRHFVHGWMDAQRMRD